MFLFLQQKLQFIESRQLYVIKSIFPSNKMSINYVLFLEYEK